MKNLLPLSLIFNAVLLAVCGILVLRGDSSGPDESSQPPLDAAESAPVPDVPEPVPARETPDAGEPENGIGRPPSRAELEEMNHEEQVEALVAGGWSRKDAKVFALGRVMHDGMQRMQKFSNSFQDQDYWKNSSGMNMSWEDQREMMEMQHRMQEVMEDLYGEQAPGMFGNHSVPIAPEKARAAAIIQQDYQMMQMKLRSDVGGIMLPEDHEALALLEEEKKRDLEEVLTPEELFEYEVRTSSTAMSLRHQLSSFEPTEEEFREIFRLQREVDRIAGGAHMAGLDEATRERQSESREEMQRQLEETLGEERFEQYTRSQDWGYGRLVNVAQRLDLPRERVDEVYDLKEYAEGQQQELRSDDFSSEERSEAMETLTQETRAELVELLGERGLELYEQNGGNWLQRLQ